MPSPTRISFIRHGTVANPEGIIYGRLPRFALSRQGRDEARRAGEALRQVPLAALYSSPLLRTRQTAREVLRHHPGLRLHLSTLINEVFTPFEGQQEKALAAVAGDVYSRRTSPGEQPDEIAARAERFVQRLRRRHAGSHVAAVSHGDVIFFLLLKALGYAVSAENKTGLGKLSRIREYPATGSITTFTFPSGEPSVRPVCSYRRAEEFTAPANESGRKGSQAGISTR